MSEKSIDQRIIEKRDKLISLHGSLAVLLNKPSLSYEQRAKASELQDRLEFRVKQAEEQLLDDKIDIYDEVVKILRK